MSIILGINKDHPDSSVCLLINGKLIGAVAEERLGKRIKHDSSFPKNSIQWLINLAEIKYSDIDIIAVSNNPLFYDLTYELKKITEHGIILNTSFNENEPIVDTPKQAIDCFLRTDMDVLFLENYMLSKDTSLLT